ncbi:PadR family transcriptional regulator [Brevibacillus fulvus]|uniref:DNA-binding PadR family transcriptional regulator n=1 Tax=Brevibacillus fulvus TaxID=1125967 RepID=A0A938XYS8_9BACL|nr:PadR family transcriptional regulator [Brevibacillus fulvus]MBM7590306.1 DNA-binding PadR family transcriptional regulator [Brevibacillus fulvus]
MNSLAYALLSMLVRKPCSGYELKQLLEVFWQAKHSQIYPLLQKLEQDGLLTYELVGQSGKPDKKIYTLTDKGLSILKEWIAQSPAVPVIRDEFLVKVYAIWLTDIATAKKLFDERMRAINEKIAYREEELRKMRDTFGDSIEDIACTHFGRYILYQRRLRQEREEIEWCKWVMNLLEKSAFS